LNAGTLRSWLAGEGIVIYHLGTISNAILTKLKKTTIQSFHRFPVLINLLLSQMFLTEELG
jgi:hypothetical protein